MAKKLEIKESETNHEALLRAGLSILSHALGHGSA